MIKEEWDDTFKERLKERYDELKWLYAMIYNNDMDAFAYFLSMLHSKYQLRSKELKDWDEGKSVVDDWFTGNEMLGMLMYTDCFAGNLKGVKKHLDYIEECKVNYLHLMPLLKTPKGKSDGGYAVEDFRTVDERLGTMKDLAELTAACHERGISVCLDFVMNHTSSEHEWAKKAKEGIKEYQDRYFFYDDRTIPDEYEKTVPEVFPTTAPGNFTYCPEVNKHVMTSFYPYQWDLNYHNPTVFNDMTENMLFLCNQGVDIIRLDAVPYIWKELHTTCRNLPEVHTLVRIMRIACEIVCPGTLLLGEVVMEPSKVVPYFGTIDKPECHMLYNVTTMASTWHTVATKDVRLMKHQLGTVFALPKEYVFLNYLRCHDDIGWGLDYDYLKNYGINEADHKKFLNDYLTGKVFDGAGRGELYNDDPKLKDARLCGTTASLCGIESALFANDKNNLKKAINLDMMLHAFLLTQSGIPVLYSGDEIGQLNDYDYHNDPDKADDSRYLHRGAFDWDKAKKRNVKGSVEEMLYTGLKKLTDLRSKNRVFESQADTWIVETYNDHVLGIGRYYKGQKLIALFNFNDSLEIAWINEEEKYKDIVTGEEIKASGVNLAGYEFRWLLTTFS